MNTDRRQFVSHAAIGAAFATAIVPSTVSAASPPKITAPAGAKPVVVVVRMTAKDAGAFKAHLLEAIPVTRVASGCRYSHSYQDPVKPAEFILVQGWDSSEQQQGYIKWREATGDLQQLLAMLAKPPVVETFALFDA